MRHETLRRGLTAAALAAAALLASCSTPEPEAPPPPPPPPPPAVALNDSVAQAASIYVTFMREARTLSAPFADAEAIQVALRKGAAYDAPQLSRGMIAYGAILALQSPEFVAGVRAYAADPTQRQEIVNRIIADPAYAATFPGAASAAGVIADVLGADSIAMTAIAEAIEADAYTIQERQDPRRRWAVAHVANREARLERVKVLSEDDLLPSAEEAARLFAAAHSGTGLGVTSATSVPPYTPATVRSLALAALAALGAAGDNARVNTDALQVDLNSESCLTMSKLMLFQCLAASRPSYEDIFCAGRHVARDLGTCVAQAAGPAPTRLQPISVTLPAATVAAATPQTPAPSAN
jgi:hypothetical protein